MNKIKTSWESLPKTIKVFFFLALSTILAECLIELGGIDQTFIVRISAQIINLILVAIEESIPAIKARIKK